MKVTITATLAAIQQNTSYVPCSDTIKFDCSNAQVKSEWYLEPYKCLAGICYKKVITSTSNGKIQVVEVENNGITYLLRATLANYTDACNECCGSTPTLAPTTLPVWVPDGCICPNVDGNYVFKLPIQPVASGQQFKLSIFINGSAGVPPTSTDLTTAAGALAYAQANWADYGTWTLEGDDEEVLVLTNSNRPCIILKSALEANSYCLTVDFPFEFDEVTRSGNDGATVSYELPNGAITVADEDELATALTTPVNYFGDGTLTTPVAGKLQYVGTGRPFLLKLAGSTVGTWTTAACS